MKLKNAGFKVTSEMLTAWNENTQLKYSMQDDSESLEINIPYSLLGARASELKRLLEHSTEPRQIVRNKGTNLLASQNGWTSAIWNTYLYSFKQKRFTCTDLKYNRNTGLVNRIVFNEI